ncbi:MAG: hypothetical protein ABW131_06985 [Candidatus Sedimenticola sp. 6PFRAG5]
MSSKRKTVNTLLLLFLSLAFALLSALKLPLLDARADAYFSDALKGATVAYAATRGVNAVVSVLKESEVEVSPVGVGVNIAVGQILDPIDDMTERASSILVTAIVALGLQKIAFEIGGMAALQVIALLLLSMIPLVWLPTRGGAGWVSLVLRASAFLLLLRLLLPLSALVSDGLHSHLFQPRIDTARESLSVVSSRYETLNAFEKEEEQGLFSSLVGKAGRQVEETREAFGHVADNVEQIVGSLLELATLYVALFVIQILVIPLLFIWLGYALVRYPDWRHFGAPHNPPGDAG